MTERSQGTVPVTRHSVLAAIRSDDPETRTRAYGTLVESYWRPVYKYLRVRWNAEDEDARDFTREFFARAVDRSFFEAYDPNKTLFRTFLRTCLDRFVAAERKAGKRGERSEDAPALSLDFDAADAEMRQLGGPTTASPEAYFHKEWVRALLNLAVDDLRALCEADGKQIQFQIFERCDLDEGDARNRPSYAALATELGLTTVQVTNHLAAARRGFRRAVLARLRAASGGEEEYMTEARSLLGIRLA